MRLFMNGSRPVLLVFCQLAPVTSREIGIPSSRLCYISQGCHYDYAMSREYLMPVMTWNLVKIVHSTISSEISSLKGYKVFQPQRFGLYYSNIKASCHRITHV